MALITRLHESGIVLAEETQRDGAGLRRALKEIDDRLILWPPDAMSPYWRVMRRVNGDTPAETVLVWMDDDTTPRPLSSGILEAVQRLRRDGRNQGPSVDERNRALEEAIRKERDAGREALRDEYEPYLERGRVGVSMGPRPRKPYYQRRWNGGEL